MPQSNALPQLLPMLGAIVAFLFAALLVLYIFRLLFGQRIRGPGGRNRSRRLDIVDTFELGRDRQLVIIRRDNMEHLLMIGGPNDVLVEASIPARAEAPREQRPTPPREPATQQGAAGWPNAPAPKQQPPFPPPPSPGQPPLAASGLPQGADLVRRRAEPSLTPQPPTGFPPLPSDLFAPAAPSRPAPSPPAPPESAPPQRASGFGAPTPPLRPTPPASTGAQPGPARPSAPPFLARTQRPGGTTPPKRETLQPPPATPPAMPTPPQESATGPRESETPPAQNPPTPSDATNPLESLEAEMARLLGRPEPEQ
jgi:flagellar protein FliO/FliZ